MASDTATFAPRDIWKYLDRWKRLCADQSTLALDTLISGLWACSAVFFSSFLRRNQQLRSIPPSIADLSSFFNALEISEQTIFSSGRSLSRIKTEPPFASKARSFSRTQSIVDSGDETRFAVLSLGKQNQHPSISIIYSAKPLHTAYFCTRIDG